MIAPNTASAAPPRPAPAASSAAAFLPRSFPLNPFLLLLTFVLFNERRARAEDGREREKQAAPGGAPDVCGDARHNGYEAAERETYEIFVPMAWLRAENLKRTIIVYPSTACFSPMATTNHATIAAEVEVSAEQRTRMISWQTTKI